MPFSIAKVDVYAAEISDQPGGLAGKLEALTGAGANLEFVIARRQPNKPGTGVVFLAPIKGARQQRAAKAAGFCKSSGLHSLRLEGPDKAGLGVKITAALAAADINLRGLSAASIGRKSITYFAFDTTEDAAKAAKVLKKVV